MKTSDRTPWAYPTQSGYPGMTLRDYFAARAMSIIWDAADKGYCGDAALTNSDIAAAAYQLADAMLSAREAA
jgi:hypothetical protein